MLRFFKVNDPYRLLALLVLMLILRVPFYWGGIEAMLPDLHLMLIGERLASDKVLYKDLWVNIAPLSAGFFTILHWLFDKSIIAYHFFGFLLMFIQAMLFNRLALNNKIYAENNYVPAVIYALLMSLSVDMFAISPIMLANTFILLAMNNIFGQVEFRAKRDEKILNIGIYIGVASLFYFPTILFGLIALLGLALFSSTIFRRYLLIVFGLILPFLLIGCYYFFVDNASNALTIFFSSWLVGVAYQLENTSILILCSVPVLFLALAIFRVLQGARFSNYQARIAQMMILWITLSLLLLINPITGVSDLILFVPPIAYFITHYFILARKKLLSGITFFLFFASTIGLSYAAYFDYWGLSRYINYDPITIQKSRYDNLLKYQRIWVIGENLSLYKNSALASKFYSWGMYRELMISDEIDANQITLVYNDLINNAPDVIIDQHEVMPRFLAVMPLIDKQYELLEKGIYIKEGFELRKN